MSMFAFNVAASDHRHSASFLSRTSSMVLHGEPNVHQAARKPVSTPRNQSCQKDIWSIQRASFNTTDTNHYIAARVWRMKQAITGRLSFTGFRVCEAQVPAVLVGSLGFCHQDELNQGGLGGWARWSHRFSQWGSGSLSIRRQRCNLVTGPPFPTPSLPPAGITWR